VICAWLGFWATAGLTTLNEITKRPESRPITVDHDVCIPGVSSWIGGVAQANTVSLIPRQG
jgi:hypothetical protein